MEINLLIKPSVLKNFTSVHTNIDEKLLWPEIKAQQDIYIEPIIGSLLLKKLLADIAANTLAGDYLRLTEHYIVPCLCNYVLAELPETINYQFWNRGLVQNNSTTVNNIDTSEMYSIMSRYKTRAEFYAVKMKTYIDANKALYPEYTAAVTGDDKKPNTDNYSCAINL
jgi:hypothetical protein